MALNDLLLNKLCLNRQVFISINASPTLKLALTTDILSYV